MRRFADSSIGRLFGGGGAHTTTVASEETEAHPTPIRISKRTRNALVILCIAVAAFILWRVPEAPVALVGGFALALVLSFPVRALSRLMPRGLAIFVSYLVLIGLVLLVVLIIVPIAAVQLASLFGALPGLISDTKRYALVGLNVLNEAGVLPGTPKEILARIQEEASSGATAVAENWLGGLLERLTGTVSVVLSAFGIVFVSAYLLADVRKLKAVYIRAAPAAYRRDARDLWDAFGYSLSRYLSGLAVVVAIQGTLAAILLYLLGVPYAVALGAWTALTALIPLFGAWLGSIPALIVAFSVSPTIALLTAVLFLALHQLEGNFLAPRIHGQTLSVHPILVFLAIIVGGGLFGIFGVLFAVPALAMLRVLFDFLRVRLRTEVKVDSPEAAKGVGVVRAPAGREGPTTMYDG